MKDFRFSDLLNIAAAGFGPRSSENAVPNAGKGRLFNFAKEAIEDELDILLQKQKEAEALADKVLPLIKEQKERCCMYGLMPLSATSATQKSCCLTLGKPGGKIPKPV